MKCETTYARFSLAEYWLKEIKNTYSKNDEIIESYVEYFLVICRSIEDYLIFDFLDTIFPSIPIGERSEIIRLKKQYREKTKTLNHIEQQNMNNVNCEDCNFYDCVCYHFGGDED